MPFKFNPFTGTLDVVNTSSGSGGGGIVDSGSYGSPISITGSISAPTNQRQRTFVVGTSAVVNPTLGTGSTDDEWWLFGTSDTNTIELNSASNLLLSGKIIIKLGTILCLHWIDGLAKWVEEGRNEI